MNVGDVKSDVVKRNLEAMNSPREAMERREIRATGSCAHPIPRGVASGDAAHTRQTLCECHLGGSLFRPIF